jgi:uncharacterized membrane protein
MTASKSSRARAARAQRTAAAQASAAKNAGPAGRANGTGTAAAKGNGTAAKTGTTVKAGAPVKAGTLVKAGSSSRTPAARGGAADRRGSREPALTREATAEAPSTTTAPLWLQWVSFLLALAGLGVSIYLTIAHYTESHLLGCSESGLVNCTKVTTSPQSYVFGIPVAVLGLAFYVAAVALMSPWAWRSARREIHLLRLASVVVGIGFVLYLLYAELFIIGSICLYCTSVHAITFVLFLLTVIAVAAWGLPERQRS